MTRRDRKTLSSTSVLRAALTLLTALVFVLADNGATVQNARTRVALSLQDPSSWHQFSPEGEEFTVSLPERPRVTSGKRFFGDRPKGYKFHLYRVFADDTLYTVESYEGDRPKDLAKIVLSGRRGIRGVADIELNGVKGKEFTHDIEGLSFKARYFATRKHLYVIEVAKRDAYDPAMDQFLNSFSLERHGQTIPADATNLAGTSSDEVFAAQRVNAKAIILFKLPATYTDPARDDMINGTVVLEAVLRPTGEVTDIQVRSGLSGGLTEQSIEATKAIVFVPALKDGKTVSQRIMVEYNFNIY